MTAFAWQNAGSMKSASRLATLALVAAGCSDPVEFMTPGRVPPQPGDLVVTVDGTRRGFGAPSLGRDAVGPIVTARIAETATEATIRLPSQASTVTCAELPRAVVLTTSSPLEHANTTYFEMRWLATTCVITVTRMSAPDAKGFVRAVEGSFSAQLTREKDEISDGRQVLGPTNLTASGTFVIGAP